MVQALPSNGAAAALQGSGVVAAPSGKILTLDELEKLSSEDLEEALGVKPKFDIPPAARRSMQRVGVLDEGEGGLAATSLGGQNASLVRAALAMAWKPTKFAMAGMHSPSYGSRSVSRSTVTIPDCARKAF